MATRSNIDVGSERTDPKVGMTFWIGMDCNVTLIEVGNDCFR